MGTRIAVTGATGFIGSALLPALARNGFDAVALHRDEPVPEGIDGVINLAGETVAGRWTAQKKERIRDSRVRGTRALVESMSALRVKPRVLVSASAVGYYGSRGDEPLAEAGPPGNNFLAGVCAEWEQAARGAERFGIRTVSLRTGVVLGDGGALREMIAPFKMGAGGPFGSGKQFAPWIHLDDIVAMYLFALTNDALRGPVNAVTPDYATSARFSQALGNALGRPALIPAPGFALHAVLGEFASTLTGGQLAIPAAAQDAGFTWKHPNLEAAMLSAVGAPPSRSTGVRTFEAEQFVAQPIERVFGFFSDALNLEQITPQNLRFEILSAPDELARGAEIAYRLHVRGFPMNWRTLIAQWEPPHRFVDVQLHGPYACWNHEHTFEAVDGGTIVRDHVSYVLPFAPFGALGASLVESDVRGIFDFRRAAIEGAFAAAGPHADRSARPTANV